MFVYASQDVFAGPAAILHLRSIKEKIAEYTDFHRELIANILSQRRGGASYLRYAARIFEQGRGRVTGNK
jgi:hypothetical protein